MSENLVKHARINNSGSNVHRSMKLIHNIDMYGTHNFVEVSLVLSKRCNWNKQECSKKHVHISIIIILAKLYNITRKQL